MRVPAAAPRGARIAAWRTPRMGACERRSRRVRPAGPSAPQAIVIGAGPSGLAAAAMLERAGVPSLVLERTNRYAAPWHGHYDGLRLQSPAWMSHLPGRWFDRSEGAWITRDGFIRYLGRYAQHHGLNVRFGTTVERVVRDSGGWRAETSRGEHVAPVMVVATGYNRVPFIPEWPGLDRYCGLVLHASEFRNAEPFVGEDVLVVGAGNSAAEIAYHLSAGGARRVRIAVRTPPNVVPRQVFGFPSLVAAAAVESLPPAAGDLILEALNRPVIRDLSCYGLPPAPRGIYSQYLDNYVTPIIDTGFVGALRRRRIEPVDAVSGFDPQHVMLGDGQRISPTVVIAATGYMRGLESLVGHLGVLQEHGAPIVDAGSCPGAPGLYFIGYTHPFSGNLRRVRRDAPRLARAIAGYLDGRPTAQDGRPAADRSPAQAPYEPAPATDEAPHPPDIEEVGDVHASRVG